MDVALHHSDPLLNPPAFVLSCVLPGDLTKSEHLLFTFDPGL